MSGKWANPVPERGEEKILFTVKREGSPREKERKKPSTLFAKKREVSGKGERGRPGNVQQHPSEGKERGPLIKTR